ncbi:hypothetical protein F4680DRAFT_296058 [Xylaria scruposa]|nr:hypothetical protein F4680DRAFT_296058 [Xylaria scruposa]
MSARIDRNVEENDMKSLFLRCGNYLRHRSVTEVMLLRTYAQETEHREKYDDDIFSRAILASMDRSATRPHDYVYSMLGIFPTTNIKPDYTKSMTEVYIEAMFSSSRPDYDHYLEHHFEYEYGHRNVHGLPSWVPDLGTRDRKSFFARDDDAKPLLHSNKIGRTRFTEPDTLSVQGVMCTQVKQRRRFQVELPRNFANDFRSWFRLLVDFLVDILGISNAWAAIVQTRLQRYPAQASAKMSEREPLATLLHYLDSKRLNGYQISQSMSTNSELLLMMSISFLGSWDASLHITNDERDDMVKRLGLPDATFLLHLLHFYHFGSEVPLDQDFPSPTLSATNTFYNILNNADQSVFFRSYDGYVGIGPPNLQPGDLVCAIGTLPQLKILRKITTTDQSEPYFEFVGSCYAPGLSDGEPGDMLENGKLKIETFNIR